MKYACLSTVHMKRVPRVGGMVAVSDAKENTERTGRTHVHALNDKRDDQLSKLMGRSAETPHRRAECQRCSQSAAVGDAARGNIRDLEFACCASELRSYGGKSIVRGHRRIHHRRTSTRPPMSSSPGCPAPIQGAVGHGMPSANARTYIRIRQCSKHQRRDVLPTKCCVNTEIYLNYK